MFVQQAERKKATLKSQVAEPLGCQGEGAGANQ